MGRWSGPMNITEFNSWIARRPAMSSSAELMAFAQTADDDAAEYRGIAETASEPRRSMLLKWAENREEHADFYRRQAWYAQLKEARQEAKLQKEAAFRKFGVHQPIKIG